MTSSVVISVLSVKSAVALQRLSADTIVNAQTFPGADITLGEPIILGASTIINPEAEFGAPVVELTTPIVLDATPVVNVETFGTPVISLSINIGAPTIVNAQTFPGATLEFGNSIDLAATPVLNAQTFPGAALVLESLGGFGWRVNVYSVATAGNPPDVAEIEFRLTPGGPGDAATGGTAITGGGASPENAFDNNLTTRWASNANNTGWIGYEWAAPQIIVEVTIAMAAAVPAGRIPKTFSIDWQDSVGVWHVAWYVGESVTTGWVAGETKTISLLAPEGDVRTTQVAAEVITGPDLRLRTTQLATEALTGVDFKLRTTQMAAEILTGWPPPSPSVVDPGLPQDPEAPTFPPVVAQSWDISRAHVFLYWDYLRVRKTQPLSTSGGVSKCVYGFNPIYGKRTWSILPSGTLGGTLVGLGQNGHDLATAIGSDTTTIGYRADGSVMMNGAAVQTYAAYAAGEEINIAYDGESRKVWFGKGGVFNGSPAAGTGEAATLPAGDYYPMDHAIDLPLQKLTSFDGRAVTGFIPSAPPSGFTYFDVA